MAKSDFNIAEDKNIILSIRNGDENAFRMLYLKMSMPLRKYALSILNSEDLAYEVVQELFVTLWMNRKNIDAEKSLKNYLLRSVHNNSLQMLKQNQNVILQDDISDIAEVWEIESEKDVDSENFDTVNLHLAQLPFQSRRVVEMKYFNEMKSSEIATELSISIRTVETILYKAIKKIRNNIKK